MNAVELVGYYGGDETHALSAWTSTEREITDEKKGRIDKLLSFLAREKHHTPFEKSYLHFLVRCETASHIHMLKHRVGVSVNGESARYKELKSPTAYVPDDWPQHLQEDLNAWFEEAWVKYREAIAVLEPELGRVRAKESARFYLPYANQLTLDVSFNFRSLMHFAGLRYKPSAQREIREIAGEMLFLVSQTGSFDLSLEAFEYPLGRVENSLKVSIK